MTIYASYLSKNCVSIEPDEVAFDELSKNIEINDIKNIYLEKKAVSIHDEVFMGSYELGQSMTRIGLQNNSFKPEVIKISEILKKYKLNKSDISVIKIDIEGHESELLKDETLMELDVPMCISFHPGFFSDKTIFYESVKPFLVKKGYDINKYPHGEDFFDITID